MVRKITTRRPEWQAASDDARPRDKTKRRPTPPPPATPTLERLVGTKRPWTKHEVSTLRKLSQATFPDQHAAYNWFLDTMATLESGYVARTYVAFVSQLSRVRRAAINAVDTPAASTTRRAAAPVRTRAVATDDSDETMSRSSSRSSSSAEEDEQEEEEDDDDDDEDYGDDADRASSPSSTPVSENGPTPTRYKRGSWAPGQWEAWKMHLAQEEARPRSERRPLQVIVDEFNALHARDGWLPKSIHAIRSHRLRVGEADKAYRSSHLTEQERQRALELFKLHGRSWVKAVRQFNEETGRNVTRGALVQSVRRLAPSSSPDKVTMSTKTRRPWTQLEVQEVLKLTDTKASDQHAAYTAFLERMTMLEEGYVPRTFQAFLSQLGLVRRAAMVVADR